MTIKSNKQNKPWVKYIFDSHVFDAIVSGELDVDKIIQNKTSRNTEFFITHIQVDEINECRDKEKRAKLFLSMAKLRPTIIPTSSFVFDISRLNNARLGNGAILEELRQGNIKHTKDALIGETAIKNNLILITNDQKMLKRVLKVGGRAISLEEFLKGIS